MSKGLTLAVVAALLILLSSLVLATFGLIETLRTTEFDDRHDDIASGVFAGLGVIVGVMLAQLVVVGWGGYQAARTAIFREAAALRNLVRLAEGFDASHRMEIIGAIETYSRAVIDVEWPSMRTRQKVGAEAEEALHDLFGRYATADKNMALGKAYLDASIAKLENLSDARAERLDALRSGLPGFMWGALIAQTLVFLVFVAFFGLRSILPHFGMLAALAATIVLLLILVLALDNPYWPPAGIKPDPFTGVVLLAQSEAASHPVSPGDGEPVDSAEPRRL